MLTSSEQGKVLSDKVVNVLNSWNTWGPYKGESQLFNFTARSRLLYAADTHWVLDWWPAMPQSAGMVSQTYVLDVTIKKQLEIQTLSLWALEVGGACATTLVYGLTPSDKGTAVVLTQGNPAKPPPNSTVARNLTMASGSWFFFVSPNASATHMFYIQDEPVDLRITSSGVDCVANVSAGKTMQPGDRLRFSLLSFGITLQTNLDTVNDTLALHNYLMNPTVTTGAGAKRNMTRAPMLAFSAGSILDLQSAEVSLPKPAGLPHGDTDTKIGAMVPLQLCDLNPRWAVGLYQKDGYMEPGYYNGTGTPSFGQNRYTALGLDSDNCSYAPLYVDRASVTNVTMGHPVVIAGGTNQSLWPLIFIEVVRLSDSHNPGASDSWHVSANNPTDTGFSVTMISNWDMPGTPAHLRYSPLTHLNIQKS